MRLTGKQILSAVCHHMRIHPAEIRGKSRDARIVQARVMIAQRMRDNGYTLPRIGRILNRHHTTVMSYLDPEWRRERHRKWQKRQEAKHERPETRALSSEPAPAGP